MKTQLVCELCGYAGEYHHTDVQCNGHGQGYVECDRCAHHIPITTEISVCGGKLEQPGISRAEVLENGMLVRINNPDHVWHDQIALVVGQKPQFYRLEFNGAAVWIPKEWVNKYEHHDVDE